MHRWKLPKEEDICTHHIHGCTVKLVVFFCNVLHSWLLVKHCLTQFIQIKCQRLINVEGVGGGGAGLGTEATVANENFFFLAKLSSIFNTVFCLTELDTML